MPPSWRVSVDRGGTFTDVVAHRGHEVRHAKVLSRGNDAIVNGIRAVLNVSRGDPLPCDDIEEVRLGTTVATNALLTRSGDRAVLVVTAGFHDLPVIGDQARPDLFALNINRPMPLAERVVEADERIDVHGVIHKPLDEESLSASLLDAYDSGIRSVAIALMHGWQHPVHETRIAAMAKEIGFTDIVTSEISPLRGLVPRLDTVMLDASLTPVLQGSLSATRVALQDVPLYCMQSNGGLVDDACFRSVHAVLSGPAGGLMGAAAKATMHGINRIVAFDMGGTSTDVSWYDGTWSRDIDAVLAGTRIRVPMLRVHTVAAGGGSQCVVRGGRLRVGPESAGANPGPACYGLGGPLTLTDCQVLLGRLPVESLPAVFGQGGDACMNPHAAEAAAHQLAVQAGMDIPELAEGFLAVAVESIAAAIGEVTMERGHDARQAALCAFGGAAGQVACRLATRLGMRRILIPARAGVLSAEGIAGAVRSQVIRRSVEVPLSAWSQADSIIRELIKPECDGQKSVVHAGIRAEGWDRSILVPWSTPEEMSHAFRRESMNRFGFQPRGELWIESVEVDMRDVMVRLPPSDMVAESLTNASTTMWTDSKWQTVSVCGDDVQAVSGPAILLQHGSTVVLEEGWKASRDVASGDLILDHEVAQAPRVFDATNPADLEVVNRRFLSICREMGSVLQHTAVSVNVKERRDYSCAIFDSEGALVANGPHMPVHLGSMGESVRRVLSVHRESMNSGDAFVDNDPSHGGTHLPDLTVVTPVIQGGVLKWLLASRAHHADVGGTTPGSMPADSTTIEEEGVVIDAMLLVRSGELLEADMRQLLASGPWPARNPTLNMEDLRAQLAANARGQLLLDEMACAYGDSLVGPMSAVRRNAADCVREAIKTWSAGTAKCVLDAGSHICVEIEPQGERLRIDFSGTSQQQPSNLNAPPAVVRAAVLYVLRCLLADEIPLNEGCLDPVDLHIPDGCMLSPAPGAAVVGGNVETSQIIVDALLLAFGVQAASQGTMNNLTFGNDSFQYYETICGGSGAGPGFAGTDAVHTHMTNSLLTDPEVLEARLPIRVARFSIRHGSGGTGRWNGGDGVHRSLQFLKQVHVSLLSGRRQVSPPGLDGGGCGLPGTQHVLRASGSAEAIDAQMCVQVDAGDVLVIETPGGGGCGAPS